MSSLYPTPPLDGQYLITPSGDGQIGNSLFRPVQISFGLIDNHPYILLMEPGQGGRSVENIRLDSRVSLDSSAGFASEILRLSLADRRTLTVEFQNRENTLQRLSALKEKIILSTCFFPSDSLSDCPLAPPYDFKSYIPRRTLSTTFAILRYKARPYIPPPPLCEINGNLQIVRSLRPPVVSPIIPNFTFRLSKLYTDCTELRMVYKDEDIDFGFQFSAISPYAIDRASNTIQLISIEARETRIYLYRTHRENIERFDSAIKAEIAQRAEESSLMIEGVESLASSRVEESIVAAPRLISVEFIRQNQLETVESLARSDGGGSCPSPMVGEPGVGSQRNSIELYRRRRVGSEEEVPAEFQIFAAEDCPFDSSDSLTESEDCLYDYRLIDLGCQLIPVSPAARTRGMTRVGTPRRLLASSPPLFCQDSPSGDFLIATGDLLQAYSLSLDEGLHTQIDKTCEFRLALSPGGPPLLPTKLEFLTPTCAVVLAGARPQGLYAVDFQTREVEDRWGPPLAGHRVLDFCVERSPFKQRPASKRLFVLTDKGLLCFRPGENSPTRVIRDLSEVARRNLAGIRWLGKDKILLISSYGGLAVCSVAEGSIEELRGDRRPDSGFCGLISGDFKRFWLLISSETALSSAIDFYEFCFIIAGHKGIEVFEVLEGEGEFIAKTGEYRGEGRVVAVGIGRRHCEYIVVEHNSIYILHNHH